jgi:hypothetical protein
MVSVKGQHRQRLLVRYRKLSMWNKLAAWGALASIVGLIAVAITSICSLRPTVASAVETPIGEVVVGPTAPSTTRTEEVGGLHGNRYCHVMDRFCLTVQKPDGWYFFEATRSMDGSHLVVPQGALGDNRFIDFLTDDASVAFISRSAVKGGRPSLWVFAAPASTTRVSTLLGQERGKALRTGVAILAFLVSAKPTLGKLSPLTLIVQAVSPDGRGALLWWSVDLGGTNATVISRVVLSESHAYYVSALTLGPAERALERDRNAELRMMLDSFYAF